MSTLTFRNNQGELVDVASIASTDAKNSFGTMLDRVVAGSPVAITRHDAPRAVLISYEEFQSLARGRTQALDALDAEFDELLARMQTAKAKKGMSDAFAATPAMLGRAALKAARVVKPGRVVPIPKVARRGR